MTAATEDPELDRRLGIALFNATWTMMEQADRTVAGQPEPARRWTEQALAALADVADEHDRDLVLSDLETIPGQPRFW